MEDSILADPGSSAKVDDEKTDRPESPSIAKRVKPTKALPSERVSFSKQLDILRAYVAASAGGTKPCSLAEVADVAGLNSGSISVANPFFTSCGLIQRIDGGFMPAPEVIAFHRAFEWNATHAAEKLAATLKQQWFYETLAPRLSFSPIEEDQAIHLLGDTAAAGPEYKTNLRMLLEYLGAANLILRDGGQVKAAKPSAAPSPPPPPPQGQSEQKKHSHDGQVPPATSGRVQINVAIDVDMTQMAGWQADRIAAFFGGIAQVIAAKGGEAKNSA